MAFRIAAKQESYFPKRKAQKKPDYLSWLHQLPCVVTGLYGVEAAHVSFANPSCGHYGRGKGTKASDRWALPLSPERHREQHSMNEEYFWKRYEQDPHLTALVLWGLYTEMGEAATEHAIAIIMSKIFKPW